LADLCARLFLCARCRAQVLLCSHCDRGQRYCGPACSSAARRANQRAAGRRYQRSPDGRIKHAARQLRWRQRRREQCARGSVTHQGSPDPHDDVPLPACPAEPADSRRCTAHDDAQAPRRCGRCAKTLPPWVRQDFLRRRRWAAGAHLAAWPAQPRGHSP
jgi:hypothetical protein